MSYSPTTDFLGLLRQTAGGVRSVRTPGLDYVVAALARAGLFQLYVGQTAPTTNQATTVWLLPALQSWAAEGAVFLWDANAGAYAPATSALWSLIFNGAASQVVQTITAPGPANILLNASVVKVNQVVGAPITLIMPDSAFKIGSVLVSDFKGDAGTNNITVQMSGTNKLPGNNTSWTLAADCASMFFRPVSGGYVI